MSEYYCPLCGADIGEQLGFDPDAGYWTCTVCGQLLVDPKGESDGPVRFEGIEWFCDNCGAFLNAQEGFSDWESTWTCTKCGHVNNISEDAIYESEEDYQKSKSNSYYDSGSVETEDYAEEDEDEYGYGEEWKYDNPIRCECCDRLLNKQDGFDEELGYFTCEKCGYYNEWSINDYDEEDEDYVEEYDDDEEYEPQAKIGKLKQRTNKQDKEISKFSIEKRRIQRIWRFITRKKQTVGISSEQCKKLQYEVLVNYFRNREFYEIHVSPIEDLSIDDLSMEGIVSNISIDDIESFETSSQFPFHAQIKIIYHTLKRNEPPITSKNAKRMLIDDVIWKFRNAGFRNLYKQKIEDLKTGWLVKENSVEKVTIDGKEDYRKKEKFRIDAKIVISYHTFKNR